MIARKRERRMNDEMNKKLLTALILPLMLLPMVSFGYAHWTDTVTKKYKLRPGTVEIHIIQWHIDSTTAYDANCNGVLLGDEIQVIPVFDQDDQVIDLWVKADPIFPSWHLEFKMLVHVKGRLAVRFEQPEIVFAGPFPEDPCFKPIEPTDPGYAEYDYQDQGFPGMPWFEYKTQMYAHDDFTFPHTADEKPCYDKSHYTILAAPTEFRYKPCDSILIVQYLHLKQEVLPDWPQERLQEYLSCHWLRLDWEIEAVNEVGLPWGSVGEEYETDWVPYVDP
jgi:hypothetical protein